MGCSLGGKSIHQANEADRTNRIGGSKVRTFAIVNMKGGVAKTATACNMAYLLSNQGQRVLLIDNDI